MDEGKLQTKQKIKLWQVWTRGFFFFWHRIFLWINTENMISRIEIKLILNTEDYTVLSCVPILLLRPKDACTQMNNLTGVLCTRLWLNLWCCEGRSNQFLKIGVTEEALSIIISLSAAIICLFGLCHPFITSIFSPPYRSHTALNLFICHFPLSSSPLLAFWLISSLYSSQCFSMCIPLFNNRPDKPEWSCTCMYRLSLCPKSWS